MVGTSASRFFILWGLAFSGYPLLLNAQVQTATRSIGFVDLDSKSLSQEQRSEAKIQFLKSLSGVGGFRVIAESEIQVAIVKKNPLREEVKKFAADQKKKQADLASQLEAARKSYLASEFDFCRDTLEKALKSSNEALLGLNPDVPFQILELLSATEFFLGNQERAQLLLAAILDLDPSYVVDTQKFPPEFNDLFNEVRRQPRFPMEWVQVSPNIIDGARVSFMGQMVSTKNEKGFFVEVLKGHPFWGKKGIVIEREGYAPILLDLHELRSDLEFVSLEDRTVAVSGLLKPIGNSTPSPELKRFIRSLKADLFVLASVERFGSGDFQVEAQWIENQSLRASPVVTASSDNLERSVERAVSELFDYLSPLGYVMTEKLAVVEEGPIVTHSKPWYKEWWAWALAGALVAGAGTGGYFLLKPEDNLRVRVGAAQ